MPVLASEGVRRAVAVVCELCYAWSMFKDIYAISYKMKRELYHKVFTVVLAAVSCFAGISLFMTFVLFPVRETSVSMLPDVAVNGFSLATPLLRSPRRGDVMLVQAYPAGKNAVVARLVNQLARFVTAQQWQPLPDDRFGNRARPFVRRVIGMPGDTIYLNDYIVYVKPRDEKFFRTEFELTRTKYDVTIAAPPPQWDVSLGAQGKTEPVTLGDGEYFVLGDNRLVAADSRLWGAVTQEDFRGKLLVQYVPFTQFRVF